MLKRYSPKVIVLDLSPYYLEKSPGDYDRLSALQPYYATHPELRRIVLLKGPYEKIQLLSSIYTYNSSVIESIMGVLDLHKKRLSEPKLKGFKQQFEVDSEAIAKASYSNNLDTNCVNVLKSFITDCNQKGIKLFVVISPFYRAMLNQSKSVEIAENLANDNTIILDYSQDKYFLSRPWLFKNFAHLNVKGAEIFSKIIASKLKAPLNWAK